MRILVTGAGGQLGRDVCHVLLARGIEHMGTISKQLDITNKDAVVNLLASYRPDGVIHCAAYTKVDQSEMNKAEAFAVNEAGTRNVAQACSNVGAKFLYLSTDYVFSGDKEEPYDTDDLKAPINVYGQSKAAGEEAAQASLSQHFIVRTSWAFGTGGDNFVKSMLRLAQKQKEIAVVCDQLGSPTYTGHLAEVLCNMIQTEQYGVYHVTNEGECTWADFAKEIFRQTGQDIHIRPITSEEYAAPAKRPKNSRLSKRSMDKAGLLRLPTWQDALTYYLNKTKTN